MSWKFVLYDWGGLNVALFRAINAGTPEAFAPLAWFFSLIGVGGSLDPQKFGGDNADLHTGSHQERLLGYTSPVIKRLVLILLLVVAPLQAAWGVAGGYCPHDERSADTQHFGHHVHEHQAAGQNDDVDSAATVSDTDCISCHLGCVGVAISPAPVLLSTPASSAVAPPARFPLSVFLQGPERPNWRPPSDPAERPQLSTANSLLKPQNRG